MDCAHRSREPHVRLLELGTLRVLRQLEKVTLNSYFLCKSHRSIFSGRFRRSAKAAPGRNLRYSREETAAVSKANSDILFIEPPSFLKEYETQVCC